jgi:hypothetical protein
MTSLGKKRMPFRFFLFCLSVHEKAGAPGPGFRLFRQRSYQQKRQ